MSDTATIKELQKMIWTTEEVAAMLGVTEYTILRFIRSGKLHPIALTKHPYRFSQAEINRIISSTFMLDELRKPTTKKKPEPVTPEDITKQYFSRV